MRLTRSALALVCLGAFAASAQVAAAQDKPEPAKEEAIVKITPKPDGGGWKVEELFEQINRTTGISILYDSGSATLKQAKVEFVGTHPIRESELFDWLQAVLSYRKLVLVPVGPHSPGTGKQQWFVMDQADPNL